MNLILDLLFPKKCLGCTKEGSYFCQNCISHILQTDLVCPNCEKLATGGQTHPLCKRKFGLDGLWSLGLYQGFLQTAIKQLKYGRVRDLTETLVDILIEYWAKYQPFILDQIKQDRGQGWAVWAVPLHWWRENSRGFNQSSVIGQMFSKKLGLDYYNGLKRIRYTTSQTKLRGKQRRDNVRDVFALAKNYPPLTANCLLIDDVWTTGSTLKECCYVLKRAGAKKVWAITLAR